MKHFFKTLFASALGTLLALGIVTLSLVCFLVGLAVQSGSVSYKPDRNAVFRLELNGTVTEQTIPNPLVDLLGSDEGQLSVADITTAIHRAKTDDRIKGIYIEAGMLETGFASAEAIRRELVDFKESGKFIISYGDLYTQGAYYICTAADSIFLNPEGNIALAGLASQGIFYTGLAEKLGVEFNIFKVGTYKSAVEPYFMKQYSEANREQLTSFLGSIWGNMTDDMSSSRHMTTEQLDKLVDEGVTMTPTEQLLEAGLIDALRYRFEAEATVKALAGQDVKSKLKTGNIREVASLPAKEKSYADKIAVLYAEGEIVDEAQSTTIGSLDANITQDMVKQLRKLKEDESVKAVVFRVNSPGGSAYVSEQIWREVIALKAEKPIVVSMGDYAASGGYYISCAANKIVAERTTLTGSIGVFGLFPNFAGTVAMTGVTTDVVKTSRFADMGDYTRPMREDEKALVQRNIEHTYDLFLTRCSDGRGMSKEAIDAIGQGRVWTGEQALEIGLVDQIGGLQTAINEAASLADLTGYEVIIAETPKDIFSRYLDKQMEDVKLSITQSVMGKESFRLFSAIRKAQSESGILARMPFANVGF